ncbi:MAG: hypothetical protein ABR608_15180, partial [Pseudonocardiaceae bacterium]
AAATPHSAAEQDSGDPSRAANQVRSEPIAPRGVDDDVPAADTNQLDTASDESSRPAAAVSEPDRPQAGAPEETVTDPTPALGTSEAMQPVQGEHTSDIGPGGGDIDTDAKASRSRAAGTS